MARVARASRGSQQQARTSAYALARPLRGLRRGFEVGERLGHLFPVPALRETDENLTEIIQKRRPEGPKSPPGASWGLPSLPGARFGPPGAHFWPPGAHVGPPGALLGLSRRSPEPLGSVLGLPKWVQEALPEASGAKARFSKHFGCHFGSIFGSPGPRKSRFSCGKVAFFRKSRGSKKATKNYSKQKPGYHGTGSARDQRACKPCK